MYKACAHESTLEISPYDLRSNGALLNCCFGEKLIKITRNKLAQLSRWSGGLHNAPGVTDDRVVAVIFA